MRLTADIRRVSRHNNWQGYCAASTTLSSHFIENNLPFIPSPRTEKKCTLGEIRYISSQNPIFLSKGTKQGEILMKIIIGQKGTNHRYFGEGDSD